MKSFVLMLGALLLAAATAGSSASRAAELPRVLILGDSISIGYTPFVKAGLKDVAEVIRPAENCSGTTHGVAQLDKWLALGNGKWDVIHFNFGLHDLKRVIAATGAASRNPEDPRQAELPRYETQLTAITDRLKKTGARLIYAATTPVPAAKLNPHRDPEDVLRYNAVAARVMKERGVSVNDLYAFALPRLSEIQRPMNVHFTDAGSQALAGEVVSAIKKALP